MFNSLTKEEQSNGNNILFFLTNDPDHKKDLNKLYPENSLYIDHRKQKLQDLGAYRMLELENDATILLKNYDCTLKNLREINEKENQDSYNYKNKSIGPYLDNLNNTTRYICLEVLAAFFNPCVYDLALLYKYCCRNNIPILYETKFRNQEKRFSEELNKEYGSDTDISFYRYNEYCFRKLNENPKKYDKDSMPNYYKYVQNLNVYNEINFNEGKNLYKYSQIEKDELKKAKEEWLTNELKKDYIINTENYVYRNDLYFKERKPNEELKNKAIKMSLMPYYLDELKEFVLKYGPFTTEEKVYWKLLEDNKHLF